MNAPAPIDITDSPLGTYQKRKGVYPKAVDGSFRRLKWAVMIFCLAVYYVTPWIRWDRGPYAPDQAVLVDLAGRRFFMFGIEIWPHEFYYVAGLLIMAGIGLFLVTSAVGRAWCGYACPQTVWTDLYQHVERFIDGDRNAQVRLANAPWGAAKLGRRLLKWGIWLAIAVATGGAWIFYFADAPTLARDFLTGEAPFVAYATVGILTGTTFILGGFLREQVCIYMCPWPRIQTAMLDEKSLLVTYRHWRGEPRGSLKELKKAEAAGLPAGDCIDCNQCVAVCPTGVDIRQGSQIGCITCALCIDACDKVMAQVGKPRGLIDYVTLDDAAREQAGGDHLPAVRHLLRPRTLIYFGLWCGIGLGLLFALGSRTRIDVNAIADRNPPFVRLSDGAIRNSYTVKVRNMENRPRRAEIGIEGLRGAVLWQGEAGARDAAAQSVAIDLPPDNVAKLRLFVAAPAGAVAKQDFAFTVRALDKDGGSDTDQTQFESPAP